MEEILKDFLNAKIDVSCGNSANFRGTVEEVRNGIVRLSDDHGKQIYISIEKINAVAEKSDSDIRPGFINQ